MMLRLNFFRFLILAVIFSPLIAFAQPTPSQTSVGTYNPQETFAQGIYTKNGNLFRSANGAPSAKYWQNRADYTINASLDTVTNQLNGNVVIHYTNNSPDSLHSLWLQLDQNTYRKDARSNFYTNRNATEFTNGYTLASVQISQNGKTTTADYIVNDTRMQIRLQQSVAANGGKINIIIK